MRPGSFGFEHCCIGADHFLCSSRCWVGVKLMLSVGVVLRECDSQLLSETREWWMGVSLSKILERDAEEKTEWETVSTSPGDQSLEPMSTEAEGHRHLGLTETVSSSAKD